MHLDKITASCVNAAIELYLRLAYDDAVARDKHAVRFRDDQPIQEVLAAFVSETSSLRSWSLRLGSQEYPHMKLMLREAYIPGEFAFTVDRHDCFAFNRESLGNDRWIELQSRNHQLKKAIEDAWGEAGIPTLCALREKLLSKSDFARATAGKKILLVENDPDAVAIMEMILKRDGYGCYIAESVRAAQKVVAQKGERILAALVDLLLPDGMGPDVVAAIRGNPATQNLPVLIMSGMPENELDYEGADGYLRKPFSSTEVTRLLDQIIKRYYEADGELVRRPSTREKR